MRISIGELARRTGVKVPTIRYYEGVGLLRTPARTEGRQRRFGADEVADIRELLTLSEQPERSCGEVDAIARRHVENIDRRIGRLVALRAELQRSLDRCARGTVEECRVIEVLGYGDDRL
ncbi:MerR family DNA-binding transcriptional regulator [Gluconobacter wancherniae]|uniref:MerR family DNA-binding transcriptional regulator n=1 Tax=Gluconobacter wancherniae TaxID=1307955 RepID=UPI00309513E4